MINKIGNWVFGSFFRTIGRLLVFVLLGVIIANLVDFSDIISNFRITDLFFEKVNASTISWVGGLSPTNVTADSNNNGYYYFTMYEATNIQQKIIGITLSDNKHGNELRIPFLVSGDLKKQLTMRNGNGSYNCSNWRQSGNDYYCTTWEPFATTDTIVTDYELNLNILLGYYDGGYGTITCTIDTGSNTIICPLFNSTSVSYTSLQIFYTYKQTGQNQTINFNINSTGTILISDTQEIINSQNQNTQQQMEQQDQQHEQMMDSNTTQAQEDAEGFFGDFSVPDTGGLSGIITAPLNTIRSLLNSTCTNLVLPLPFVNQNLTLPCLYDIYNEHFGAFFTIYQTIVLAIVAYRCIRSIYFDIHGFMDPNDDRIEVMDL